MSGRRLALRRFVRHRGALAGAMLALGFAVVSVLAPWLSPYEPDAIALGQNLQSPSWRHPFGTDSLASVADLNLFQELAGYGGVAFLGAVGTVLSFTVMLFILFFIIRDGRAIARLGSTLVPLPAERREALADRLATVTRAVVRGTVLTSMVQGLLLGIGFAIVGMPAPVVFGVLAAVLSVVPFGGTALVWVPALATLLIQGRYGQAVGILVVGVIVSSVDNFIKPLLISGRSPLPTLAGTFRGAGYQTYAVRKLHVYPPRHRIGFDDALIAEGISPVRRWGEGSDIGKAAAATLTIIPEEFRGRQVTLEELCDILLGAIIKRHGAHLLYKRFGYREVVQRLESRGRPLSLAALPSWLRIPAYYAALGALLLFGYFGPQMLGILRDRTGSFAAGFYMVAIADVITLVLIAVLYRMTRRETHT